MRYSVHYQLLPSAARTATIITPNLHIPRGARILALAAASSGSGTNPTMQIAIQAITIGGNAANLAFGTTQTAAGVSIATLNFAPDLIRVAVFIGGTSPSFTFELDMILELIGPDAP